jgi:hypothetical protein
MSEIRITDRGVYVGLDHQEVPASGRREVSDLVGDSSGNSFIGAEPQVMVVQVAPLGVSQGGPLSQDGHRGTARPFLST